MSITIQNKAAVIEKLKALPQFKTTPYHELVNKVESKSADIPAHLLIKLARQCKSPMTMSTPIMTKAASGDVTNTVANTLPLTVRTPANAYNTLKSDVLLQVLEVLPVVQSNEQLIKVENVDEAEEMTAENTGMTLKGGTFSAQSIPMKTALYHAKLSNQYLDDETSFDLFTTMALTKVRKLSHKQMLTDLKALKEALTVTETELADKLNEALKALPEEIEARLIVLNSEDMVALDKYLLANGQVSAEVGGFMGIPVLKSDVADAHEALILTNSAILFYEGNGAIQYGTSNTDFSENFTRIKVLQRCGAAALTNGAVYSVALA